MKRFTMFTVLLLGIYIGFMKFFSASRKPVSVPDYQAQVHATKQLFTNPVHITMGELRIVRDHTQSQLAYSFQIQGILPQVPRYFMVFEFHDELGSLVAADPVWIDSLSNGWTYGYYPNPPEEFTGSLTHTTLFIRTIHDLPDILNIRNVHITVTAMKNDPGFMDAVIYDSVQPVTQIR